MRDITRRVREAWEFYDELLDQRIAEISELSGVAVEHFVKINPAEFIEKNKHQSIVGYEYKNIGKWILQTKDSDDKFLISPLDAVKETAAQVSYKSGTIIERKIRASKCVCVPVPVDFAQDFFIRNHRQSAPLISNKAICFGLLFNGEIVAVMLYDISAGAVREKNKKYKLVRLSISKGTQVYGGASKLQAVCENSLREIGAKKIYSYSNATINSGAVYEKLGFSCKRADGGQPFVILNNNKLERLINLYPESTDEKLAFHGWIKTHVGGNKVWEKDIS